MLAELSDDEIKHLKETSPLYPQVLHPPPPDILMKEAFNAIALNIVFFLGNITGLQQKITRNGKIITQSHTASIYRSYGCLKLDIDATDDAKTEAKMMNLRGTFQLFQRKDRRYIRSLRSHYCDNQEPFDLLKTLKNVAPYIRLTSAFTQCTSHYHHDIATPTNCTRWLGMMVCGDCKMQHEKDFKLKRMAMMTPDASKTHVDIERGKVTKELRTAILRRDKWQCTNCNSRKNLHIDHIIPVSRGGYTVDNNLQVLCQSCNSSKGAKMPEEWERYKLLTMTG